MTSERPAGGELTDDALQDEIELVGELVVAASAGERALTDEEIDEALGINPGGPVRREGGSPSMVRREQDA
jgi:hypothetical protein